MKKISFFLVAVLAIVLSGNIQSCKPSSKASASKMLKFSPEQGKGYDYEMVMDLDTKAAGQESAITLSGIYSMDITSVDNNVRTISTSYKSIKMKMDMMGMNIEIDSDKPVPDGGTDMKQNPLGAMNKVMTGLVGKKFIIKVDEEGKVLAVEGFEKILTDMVDSMGVNDNIKAQVMASLKDQYSNQSIKDQFAQIFTIFPNKEIKVGDTWEKIYSTGGKMAAKFTTNYTVKNIEGDHVTLVADTKISSTDDNMNLQGTQSGNIIVDSKTGLMINSEFDQDMEIKAGGQTVKIIGKGRIKGTAH